MIAAGPPIFMPPILHADLLPTGGRIGPAPEDFEVDELPAYEPCGEGPHVYLQVRKRLRTTPEVQRILGRAAGVDPREIGYAGLKDRHAVTTQWFSLPATATSTGPLELPSGVEIVAASRHRNKLRTGHLHGNRFSIRLVDPVPDAVARAREIAARVLILGVPNFYGPQRFGRRSENLSKAMEWARTGRADRFERKMLPSVLQSEVFNRYLARRMERGVGALLSGEIVRLQGTGSHFRVEDVATEQPRLDSGDLVLTGPMFGPRGRQATDEALAMEEEVVSSLGLTDEGLARVHREAPGTRRDLFVVPEGLEVVGDDGGLVLRFSLPAGAYATQVVREFTHAPWLQVPESGGSHVDDA